MYQTLSNPHTCIYSISWKIYNIVKKFSLFVIYYSIGSGWTMDVFSIDFDDFSLKFSCFLALKESA